MLTQQKPLFAGVLRQDMSGELYRPDASPHARRGLYAAERTGFRTDARTKSDGGDHIVDHVVGYMLQELTW